jgi:hypothetical protein
VLAVAGRDDPFLDLRRLSFYSSLSVRKLRDYIKAPVNPLPAYQVGGRGKILVRRSEFDRWMTRRRVAAAVDRVVDDVLSELAPEQPA